MFLTPKLAAAGLASTVLLTGCSATVNAPINTNVNADIHDNTVNGTYNATPNPQPTSPVFNQTDPNAPQDTPDSWSSDSVDTPPPAPLPTPIG